MRRASWFNMASVALGGLIFSFSGFAVLHGIVYALLPMVEKARSASFAIFIFHFGVIVLSAFAIDIYLKTSEFWVRRVVWSLIWISLAVFFLELALNMTQVLKAYDYDRLAGAACYGLLLAALLYAWRFGHIQPNTGIALAILLLLLQAGLETGFAWPNKERPSEYLKKMSDNTDIVEFIRRQPKFVRLEVDDQEIPYNFNDWHGIDSLNGYLASLTTNIGHVQGDYRARMVFGVNLWIGKKPSRENQQEVFVGKSGLKVYLNPEAYPESWIVHEAVGIRRDAVIETFQKYDLQQMRQITFVRDMPAPKLDKCSAPEWSEVTRRGTSGVTIEAALGCTGMVVLDDAYYPGWGAKVDGAAAPIYEAYGMVRGVVAPAGRHRIEMNYRPKSVYLGAILTGLGFLGACLLAKFGAR